MFVFPVPWWMTVIQIIVWAITFSGLFLSFNRDEKRFQEKLEKWAEEERKRH